MKEKLFAAFLGASTALSPAQAAKAPLENICTETIPVTEGNALDQVFERIDHSQYCEDKGIIRVCAIEYNSPAANAEINTYHDKHNGNKTISASIRFHSTGRGAAYLFVANAALKGQKFTTNPVTAKKWSNVDYDVWPGFERRKKLFEASSEPRQIKYLTGQKVEMQFLPKEQLKPYANLMMNIAGKFSPVYSCK